VNDRSTSTRIVARRLRLGAAGVVAVMAYIGSAAGCEGERAGAPPPAMPPAASSAATATATAVTSTAPAPSAPPSASAAAGASPPPVAGQSAEVSEGDEHRRHHYAGVLGLVAMSLNDLDLTADQRTSVEKVRADLVADFAPARAAGKDVANLLADGVAAGAINRAKVDAAIDKLSAQVGKAQDGARDALNRLHAALTPQQRAALVDDVQAHWEKWKAAHGEDEKEDGHHRSGYLLALVKELNLSRDEAQKIKASFRDLNKGKSQDHQHKEVVDHLQAFATAFKSDKFDAKKLAGGNAAGASLAKWGATRRARFLEAAAPILTPDQRSKLAQMIREWGDRPEP